MCVRDFVCGLVFGYQGRRQRAAGAVRSAGRQALARELPGAAGHVRLPKVLDEGYLALGKARFEFAQRER